MKKENLTENLFYASLMHSVVYFAIAWGSVPFWHNTILSNLFSLICLIVLNYRLSKDKLWSKETSRYLFWGMGFLVLSTLALYLLENGNFNKEMQEALAGDYDSWQLGAVIFAYAIPLFFAASLPFFGIKLVIEKVKEKRGKDDEVV